MEGENLQPGLDKPGKSQALTYVPNDEKIEVEIREIIRVRPQDFAALKASFEEWVQAWD